jgi:hypothetical protein
VAVAESDVQSNILHESRHSESSGGFSYGANHIKMSQTERGITAMEWTYRISAAARPKVLMRVVQVFDHQLVAMRRCSLDTAGELLELEIAVDIEQQLAQRIHAKLYKKLDLLQIDLIAGQVPSLDKQTALLTMPKI